MKKAEVRYNTPQLVCDLEKAKRDKSYKFWHKTRSEIAELWNKPAEYNEVIASMEYQDHCLDLEIDSDLEGGEAVLAYYMNSKEEGNSEYSPDDWVECDCTKRVSSFKSWQQLEADMWRVIMTTGKIDKASA